MDGVLPGAVLLALKRYPLPSHVACTATQKGAKSGFMENWTFSAFFQFLHGKHLPSCGECYLLFYESARFLLYEGSFLSTFSGWQSVWWTWRFLLVRTEIWSTVEILVTVSCC
eukprot:RCo019928